MPPSAVHAGGGVNLPDAETVMLYLALVPYHPAEQAEETTADQVRLVDENLGDRPWDICTECRMARAEREEIPTLLDLHLEVLATHGGTR